MANNRIVSGETCERVTISLPPSIIAIARALGGDNLSAGVRQAILYANDRRRPYPGRSARSLDRGCRNNGSCSRCRGNRLHKHRRRTPIDHDV